MMIRVIYMVVDTRRLTLYKENGETVVIEQGDPRITRILDAALPIISNGGVAEVDLSLPDDNVFDEFQEKTGGIVRFFRVARDKISSFLFGPAPVSDNPLDQAKGQYGELTDAVREVMLHGKPATKDINPETETMVAVVGNQVIPEAQQLKGQVKHAVRHGSTKGMEAFFARIAAMMEKRAHSVEDLLRFLERGDLPIADDGSIIAYKMVNRIKGDTFVDCHTGKVAQRVGSFVRVLDDLIDTNRRNDCAAGLHIARRGYLQHFSGSACLLVKVAPEDVIVVPHNDPNKVRVRAYHVIDLLSHDDMMTVRSNQPMTGESSARKMLAKAISGNHIGKIEEVLITAPKGGDLVIKPLKGAKGVKAPAPVPPAPVAPALALDDETITRQERAKIPPQAVNRQIKEASKNMVTTSPYKPLTRKQRAEQITDRLMAMDTPLDARRLAAAELKQLKKTEKVSWQQLGVTDHQVTVLEDILKDQPAAPKVSKKTRELSQRMNAGKAKSAPKVSANDNIRTERDAEVLRLHALGKNKTEISKAMGISTRQIGRILDKFAA